MSWSYRSERECTAASACLGEARRSEYVSTKNRVADVDRMRVGRLPPSAAKGAPIRQTSFAYTNWVNLELPSGNERTLVCFEQWLRRAHIRRKADKGIAHGEFFNSIAAPEKS